MRQLQKFVEIGGAGNGSDRLAYVLRPSSLPRTEGKEWYPVENFNATEEMLENPGLKAAFKMVIEKGCAVVNENDEKREKGK
jgi:hypothetical protein